PVL
ncbi:hypothetical protein D047_0086B, partial [Vibrio parahaemolyticus VPTS-2010_2]